jgi:hypothetical protein
MSDHDRRFREAVKGERDRLADEAASAAASERAQSKVAAKLAEITADFQQREGCRVLVPSLSRSEYGVFGIIFEPSHEAADIRARLQERVTAQGRRIPLPQPVTLVLGRFADEAAVSSDAVMDQLAKSFVFREKALQDLRATFSGFEDELRSADAPISVSKDSKFLVWGCVGILVLLLVANLFR